MEFQVPQFIEVEDKIFGPLTFRQFAYIAGSAGAAYLLYRLLGWWLGAIPMAAVLGFGAALSFYRFNNRPLVHVVEAAFRYLGASKLYLWRREPRADGKKLPGPALPKNVVVPHLSQSKLKDLAWNLDVNERLR